MSLSVVFIYVCIHIYIYTHTYHLHVIHSFVDGPLGCFYISAIVNNANMNIGMHVPFKISVFIFFKYIPRSGIAGSDNSSIFFLKKHSHYFTWWLLQFTLPLTVYKGSLFSTSSSTLVICVHFDDSHSDKYEVISHHVFYLNFLDY